MTGSERQIASWSDYPYTGVTKRHIRVEHRVTAEWYPGAGADIRHEIRCEKRDLPDWKAIEVWEFRDHGVEKQTVGAWKAMP